MITQYVMVEGVLDKYILETILPQDIVAQSKFIIGNGYNIALSKARSILISSQLPLLLILDSDTTDQTTIEEKKDFICQYVGKLASPGRFHVVMAVPEIEILFFQNREALELLVGSEITQEQWYLGQSKPKQILQEIASTASLKEFLQRQLTSQIIAKLRETKFIYDVVSAKNHFRFDTVTV